MANTTPTPTPETIVSSSTLPSVQIPSKVTIKKDLSKKKIIKSISKTNVEVPIFLRKTYHMIDTCDPLVASWSDNGETFVVKQPNVFETKIIPQFFKHSKFSSFVRQLNFYGFRKIKFSDTIKIDAKLEAETANFWRFRHENFIRGRPELLVDIRRSNSQSVTEKVKLAPKAKIEDVTGLKSEVNTLKDRIAQMTTNIDQLTSLVQNITMNEKKVKVEDIPRETMEENVPPGSKRKKLDAPLPASLPIIADCIPSTPSLSTKSEMDGVEFTPNAMFPLELSTRQDSLGSNISDEAFVDELFNAFGDHETTGCLPEPCMPDSCLPEPISSIDDQSMSEINSSSSSLDGDVLKHPNAPDEKLMNKLSNALTVLPKDVQEMLVNKLIATITSSAALKSHLDAVTLSDKEFVGDKKMDTGLLSDPLLSGMKEPTPDITLPLAAATLTNIISHYSQVMKNKACNPAKSTALPVIPIHA